MERFTTFKTVRMEQRKCLTNLARGKDFFAIIPTDLEKFLIYQLFSLSRVSFCDERPS